MTVSRYSIGTRSKRQWKKEFTELINNLAKSLIERSKNGATITMDWGNDLQEYVGEFGKKEHAYTGVSRINIVVIGGENKRKKKGGKNNG